MSRWVTALLLMFATGCTSNWQHAYDTAIPKFSKVPLGSVLVITVDDRPHVIANPDDRNLVGQLKGFGTDRRPIFTTRSASFAAQAGHAICNGFQAQQIDCNYVETTDVPQGEAILEYANQHGAQRILIVEITQWYVSVFALPTLQFGFETKVYSHLGDYLAGYNYNGAETLRVVEFTNPAQNASITTPEAFTRIIASIVNSQQIQRSLKVAGSL